jgi:glycosyltransferase involved in cell wall biosynthesis
MKRILMISSMPLYPANDGGRVRMHQIATHLGARYDVHVSAPSAGTPASVTTSFTTHTTPSRGIRQMFDARVLVRLDGIIRRVRPDALLLEYIWLGMYAVPLARRYHLPLMVDAWDAATTRMRRAGSVIWPAVSVYERLVLKMATRVFVASDVDRAAVVRLGVAPEKVDVVPNGVDTRVYQPGPPEERQAVRLRLGLRDGERMLFFFGQLSYAPNAAAVATLASDVMPRMPRHHRLFVAGRGGTDELRRGAGSDRITFLGPVESPVPYLRAADAVPVPLTHGSGTRLKILESVACGVPTVSTPVGCEGIDVAVCGDTLSVQAGWEPFTDALTRAAESPHMAPSEAFVRTYDWRSIVERVAL